MPTQTRDEAGAGPFLVASLTAFTGLLGTYLFFVRTTTGQFIDESALVEAVALYGAAGKAALRFLDLLPALSAAAATIALGYAALARGRWAAALIALLAAAGANATTQILKAEVLTRPFRGIETLTENSLPSGHTTLAASAAAAVFLVASPRWRPFLAFVGGTFAVVSGGSTLVNQWHRPADVVAAFLVVAAFTAPAGWAVLRTGSAWNAWEGYGGHWASSRWWLALPVLAGLAAAAAAAVALIRIAGPEVSTTHYFWAGCSLIVITGYLLAVAGAWLFGRSARSPHETPHVSMTPA
ncbi:phosphatase PAP2 family protein [Sinomonas halotolerans]|uniref:Phosphatase PAP2 family protein n=1 Tax=Sinomonas halotolerans TaxID=1644133 RepID=A0ABU9WXZ8_9MICC